MFSLIFFVLLTFFLLSRLNAILGMRVGFTIDKEEIQGHFNDVEEVQTSDIDKMVSRLQKIDKNFQLNDFKNKAQKVFGIVFTAYANEDKKTLEALLSKRIYNAFVMAINDRQKRGEKLCGEIVRFISIEVVDIQIENTKCSICVKFETEQSNVLRNRQGDVIEGDLNYVQNRTDIWLFGKDFSSRDRVWYLEEIKSE